MTRPVMYLALSLTLVGCGPAEDSFVGRFAELQCERNAECGSVEDVDACVDAFTDELETPDYECTDFQRKMARRCLNDLRKAECHPFEPAFVDYPLSCFEVYDLSHCSASDVGLE